MVGGGGFDGQTKAARVFDYSAIISCVGGRASIFSDVCGERFNETKSQLLKCGYCGHWCTVGVSKEGSIF